jgi:hypothetical protein
MWLCWGVIRQAVQDRDREFLQHDGLELVSRLCDGLGVDPQRVILKMQGIRPSSLDQLLDEHARDDSEPLAEHCVQLPHAQLAQIEDEHELQLNDGEEDGLQANTDVVGVVPDRISEQRPEWDGCLSEGAPGFGRPKRVRKCGQIASIC